MQFVLLCMSKFFASRYVNYQLSSFVYLNLFISGYTIEKIVDAVTKLVETNSIVYDRKRSDVQFYGRSKLSNEVCSHSDDESSDGEETKNPRPLQFRRNGNSIGFMYKHINLCTVESDLGGVGSLYNVVLNGSQELISFGSCLYLKGFASDRSDRFLFVACLELSIPIDSGGRFEYFLYCTTQKMLFTTTWSQFDPLKVPQRASDEFLGLANAALCDYMNKRAASKIKVRLPTKSNLKNEPSPVKKVQITKEQKKPPIVPQKIVYQKKARTRAKPVATKKKDDAPISVQTSKRGKVTSTIPPSNPETNEISVIKNENAVLKSQLHDLQLNILKNNENAKKTAGLSSAVDFFDWYFFNGKSRKFPSWTYLYDHQYLNFCEIRAYNRCTYIEFFNCGRVYKRERSPRYDDKVRIILLNLIIIFNL